MNYFALNKQNGKKVIYMKEQKILVISHNAFSTSNNMGKTLATLFNSFDANEVAQLYFHSYNPDINCCSSWFQMTDFDVIKSIVSRKKFRKVPLSQEEIFRTDPLILDNKP